MKKAVKPIAEFAPLVAFFVVYNMYHKDIILATIAIVYCTLIGLSLTYLAHKKISYMPLIAASIVAFFGGLTILSGDGIFIKIKPTVVNLVFASILFAGVYKGKGLLKYLFDSAVQMSDEAWKIFSFRWAIFFLVLAFTNEVVWRNFTEDFWVSFRAFGFSSATFVFILSQIPFLQKNIIEDDNKDEKNT